MFADVGEDLAIAVNICRKTMVVNSGATVVSTASQWC
jgi:hypothetical protein